MPVFLHGKSPAATIAAADLRDSNKVEPASTRSALRSIAVILSRQGVYAYGDAPEA